MAPIPNTKPKSMGVYLMNISKVMLCGFCAFVLPMSANALLVAPGIDVYAVSGHSYSFGGDAQIIDIEGFAYLEYDSNPLETSADYYASGRGFIGSPAPLAHSSTYARSDLESVATLINNSGGQFLFSGYGDTSAFALQSLGCVYLDGGRECNDAGIVSSSASSSFAIGFELITAYTFNLNASTTGAATFWLYDYNNGAYISNLSGSSQDLFTGILMPGHYGLRGYSSSEASTYNFPYNDSYATDYSEEMNSRYDYYLNLTPTAVPAPAAAWLFGSGLLGLIGVANRRAA
jgi:hypothetical protein